MERRSTLRNYLPLMLQTLALLGAGWSFAVSAEHRMTVVEEIVKANQQTMFQQAQTVQTLADQLKTLEKIVNSQIVLEDYIHRVKGAQ